jgi:hypothetical protein
MTPSLRYSIVIPTIDGQETLPATIASLRCQSVGDFEVVVADGSTGDATRDFVRGLGDSRIRLLRTQGLSMQGNWEAGVAEARGSYLFVLGQDDALMPDALEAVDRVVEQIRPTLISWPRHFYGWPTAVSARSRNRLSVIYGSGFARLDGEVLLREFFAGKRSFELMPMIYNSFVSRELIDRIRSRHGQYFCGEIPDVHSGIVNAYYGGEVILSNRGLSVSGSSGRSSGASGIDLDRNPDAWRRLAAGYGQNPPHPALLVDTADRLWDMMAMPDFACAYSALQAKDRHFADNDACQVDVAAWLRRIVRQLSNYPESYARRKDYIEQVARKHGLGITLPASLPDEGAVLSQGLHRVSATTALIINCEQAGVTDVAAAARLARAVLPPTFG